MIDAMKQALEALDDLMGWQTLAPAQTQRDAHRAITTLRQAISEAEGLSIAEAKKQERYFCERCGKRLSGGIHTCTPPSEAEK